MKRKEDEDMDEDEDEGKEENVEHVGRWQQVDDEKKREGITARKRRVWIKPRKKERKKRERGRKKVE